MGASGWITKFLKVTMANDENPESYDFNKGKEKILTPKIRKCQFSKF